MQFVEAHGARIPQIGLGTMTLKEDICVQAVKNALQVGYRHLDTAAFYGNDDAKGFLDEINPGNSVKANVYFDVPKGTKLKTITFDAGLFTLAEDAVVTL